MKNKTLYEILEVMPDAREADIQLALARVVRVGEVSHKQINAIKVHLLNARNRKLYDQYLEQTIATGNQNIIPQKAPSLLSAKKIQVNLEKQTQQIFLHKDEVNNEKPRQEVNQPAKVDLFTMANRTSNERVASREFVVENNNQENSVANNEINDDQQTMIWLSIFLGSFGSQFFYQKKIKYGILCILFSWTLIPLVIGIIYGVLQLKENH